MVSTMNAPSTRLSAREAEAARHEIVLAFVREGRLPQTVVEASYMLVAADVLPARFPEAPRLRQAAVRFFDQSQLALPSPMTALKSAAVSDLPRLRNHLEFHLAALRPFVR